MHSRTLSLIVVTAALLASASFARDVIHRSEPVPTSDPPRRSFDTPGTAAAMNAVAAANTTVLYETTFDAGGSCNASGWTAVDMTIALGEFFHVDDYAGLPPSDFSPLAGTKSLWCGARPQATGPLCAYQTLPGYGNDWDQAFCTKDCIMVDGNLDVSFLIRVDSEPGYDAPSVEYTTDCSGNGWWYPLDGGQYYWDGAYDTSIDTAYVVSASPVKVRIRFRSDNAWSDEDGLYQTNGGVHIDNLQVEGLALEDFEDEAVGATSANDWESCTTPGGYGIYAGLSYGAAVLQEDPCVSDISCLWNFFTGSTYFGGCGLSATQRIVPHANARGQYLWNEIWSPEIPLTGSGSELLLEFSVYRDLPLGGLIFYLWHVRETGGDCPGAWRDRNLVYYGGQKDWHRNRQPVGDLIDLASASHVQISLAARDMCWYWCGQVGEDCHTQAPLFDNVRLLRIDTIGPRWSIRDVDQFQDSFAGDGTLTGSVRADMAGDIAPRANVNSIIPGDSSVVTVADPIEGLGVDPSAGGAAVYCYVSVWPRGQPAKTGTALTGDALRYPVVGSWTDGGGVPWVILRMDSVYEAGVSRVDAYCVDFNDNLFTPGDTVCFFYAARSANAVESYAFGPSLEAVGLDRITAALNAAEFTCLPAGGPARGGDILYVDGMDGRGGQPYWDMAFASLGLLDKIDRYDVRGPSSGVSNRPAGRVKDISQLVPIYRKILWDTGDLGVGLGNGTTTPEKTNDYQLVNAFLAGVTPDGGIYVCGDDVLWRLSDYQFSTHPNGADAIAFKTNYLPYKLTTGNHRPTFGISPVGTAVSGGMFTSDASVVVTGGCPLINDFDVVEPQGTTVNQMTYGAGTATSTNGAVVSNVVGNARVVYGGFSFIYISDDDTNGRMDRADFLHDVITFLGNAVAQPTPVASGAVNSLSQNYPNPFNPQTTIAFSLRARGSVRLVIYNVSGERVRVLANEAFAAGAHTRVWDGRNDAGAPVSSGVYFYELVAGDFRQTRKMVLLK